LSSPAHVPVTCSTLPYTVLWLAPSKPLPRAAMMGYGCLTLPQAPRILSPKAFSRYDYTPADYPIGTGDPTDPFRLFVAIRLGAPKVGKPDFGMPSCSSLSLRVRGRRGQMRGQVHF